MVEQTAVNRYVAGSKPAPGANSKNAYDRCEKDRLTHAKKAAKVLRKFSDEVVLAIRNSTKPIAKLAEEYDCAKSTISGIKNRKLYRDV